MLEKLKPIWKTSEVSLCIKWNYMKLSMSIGQKSSNIGNFIRLNLILALELVSCFEIVRGRNIRQMKRWLQKHRRGLSPWDGQESPQVSILCPAEFPIGWAFDFIVIWLFNLSLT